MSDDPIDHALGRALGQLPAFDPPPDAWSAICARLAPVPPARRLVPALALVAVGVLAFALRLDLRAVPDVPPPRPAMRPPAGAAASELAARSVALERALASLSPARATRAGTGLTTALLEDRIALVDDRLSGGATGLSPATVEALLHERVLLLDSLLRVRSASSLHQTL